MSEHVQGHVEASGAAAGEERRNRETGADGGEVVVWVYSAAIR